MEAKKSVAVLQNENVEDDERQLQILDAASNAVNTAFNSYNRNSKPIVNQE